MLLSRINDFYENVRENRKNCTVDSSLIVRWTLFLTRINILYICSYIQPYTYTFFRKVLIWITKLHKLLFIIFGFVWVSDCFVIQQKVAGIWPSLEYTCMYNIYYTYVCGCVQLRRHRGLRKGWEGVDLNKNEIKYGKYTLRQVYTYSCVSVHKAHLPF